MKGFSKKHLLIASIINLAIIFRLINIAWDDSDKGIIAVIFGYPIVILANTVVWLSLRIAKQPACTIYKITSIALLLLFIPVLILAGSY